VAKKLGLGACVTRGKGKVNVTSWETALFKVSFGEGELGGCGEGRTVPDTYRKVA